MNQILKNTIALFIITAVSGLLLGAVYEGTSDARAAQAEKSKQNAYQEVFTEADHFGEMDGDVKELQKSISYSEKEVVVDEVVQALDKEGELLGYVVTVTAKEGYAGDIKFSVGIDKDKTVLGISYLTLAETAGLGMKAKDDSFVEQYVNQTMDGQSFVVDKDGGDGVVIDSISGATITSRAVTKGVNGACEIVDLLLEGGVSNEEE